MTPQSIKAAPHARSPAGIDDAAALTRRRLAVAACALALYATLGAAMWRICAAGGWTVVDVGLFACFLVATPWSLLGLINAGLGLWLLHGGRERRSEVTGFAELPDTARPLRMRSAVVMTVRNEAPERWLARLDAVRSSVEATGEGAAFDWFVLSDTSDPAIAAREEARFAEWAAGPGAGARYRRRATNEGYKAGNLRDFCRQWGGDYEFMIPLDADSLMSGEAILRAVRIGEAWPRLGILQTLVVGMPSQSAFARIFQFGMRHGMRAYTMGAAWWAGDCGPYWGHNALVRIGPFIQHCDLPALPGGAQILSHDQVEATLMRRAGYEVRVLPSEGGSYEENPPTLLEFSRRDLRWCEGNMQYWRLLGLPGLEPMSRFQLVWAIAMFIGVPAFTAMIALAALKPFDGEAPGEFPVAAAKALYLAFLAMSVAPKLAGFLDAALTPGGVARYGGAMRFLAGCVVELVHAFLLSATTTLRTSAFLLAAPFGLRVGWGAQARDAHGLSWREAARALWPQTLFGVAVLALMFAGAPALLLWSAPLTAGYLFAIPFAVATASPRLGAWMARSGLCAIPEEFNPPAEIAALRGAA